MEAKLTEILSQLQLAAQEITEALVAVAPDVYKVVLGVIRWESIGQLTTGLVLAVASVIIIRLSIWAFKEMVRIDKLPGYNDSTGMMLFGILSVIGFMIAVFFSGIMLLNIWNWVGAFLPELKLARQILDKVLGGI